MVSVSVPVIDGPRAGEIVRHAHPPILYRFPIPLDPMAGFRAPTDVPTTADTRYYTYGLHSASDGKLTYRYIGTSGGVSGGLTPAQVTLVSLTQALAKSVDEMERAFRRIVLTMFPYLGPGGRVVGPEFGLPDDCTGLGLTAGASGDGDVGLRVGWRWWLVRDGKLTGVVYKTPWPTAGPLTATHMPDDKSPHDADLSPKLECSCGIYAREAPEGITSHAGLNAAYALGIAVGWGHVVEHSHGWRAQFARPLCLVKPKEKDPVLGVIAKSYGVPFVTLKQAYKLAGEFA